MIQLEALALVAVFSVTTTANFSVTGCQIPFQISLILR
jgi:hypothetical protein